MRGTADVLPALPESAYDDTEVATNVPFNVARSDAREFGVSMAFTGTASNCVQIAFGRDVAWMRRRCILTFSGSKSVNSRIQKKGGTSCAKQ